MKSTHPRNQRIRFESKLFMKTGEMTLSIFMLVLLFFFSSANPASAHDVGPGDHTEGTHTEGITADQVDIADEQSMRNFLRHAISHYDKVTTLSQWSELKELQSIEGGDWRKETLYLLRLSDGDNPALMHHPYYPTLQGGTLSGFEDDNGKRVMVELLAAAEAAKESDQQSDDPHKIGCVDYTLNGVERVACAIKGYESNRPIQARYVLVSGLHHDFRDISFANIKCPYYDTNNRISAVDVVDEETLKMFVDAFVDLYLTLRDEQLGVLRTLDLHNCFRVSPWRSGSIYLFLMTQENRNVLLNGLDPDLENGDLNLIDEAGNDVGELIVEAVKDLEPRQGAFVNYLWDDPLEDGDEVRDENGNLIPGKAPGNSPKTSYVVRILSSGGNSIIMGSGIYPEDKDGGCVIAGVSNGPKNTIFNLFLIASALLSATLWKNRSAKKGARKSKTSGASLVCALALLLFLSAAPSANAHEDDHEYNVTADNVDVTNMESVRNFVLHAKAHWESITDPNDNIEFERGLTVDPGDWKNGEIYLMVIDENAVIYTQPHLPDAQNGALLSDLRYSTQSRRQERTVSPVVKTLIDGAETGICATNDEGRYSCAVKFMHPVWRTDLILVGGYHHSLDDVIFDPVVCPYFVSEIINEPPYFKQGINADKVTDSSTLKQFVNEFVKHFGEQVTQAGQNPAQLARIRNCWRTLPWKHEGIYLFIMTEDGLVFFNGNTPALENGTINLVDDNGCNVGNEIIRVIDGQDRECKDLGLLPESPDTGNGGAFVEYLWDDPTDDIPADEASIAKGGTPGDVPKLSYVAPFSDDNFLGGTKVIIGSGFHPEVGDDDDGCAIAGTGGTAKGALLNLLLIVSVLLFPVAFWKNLSREEQT